MLIPQLTTLGLNIHKSGLFHALLSIKDRIVDTSIFAPLKRHVRKHHYF